LVQLHKPRTLDLQHGLLIPPCPRSTRTMNHWHVRALWSKISRKQP
jgi:hypothetical protein